jgi:hypothetical protein
LPLYTTEAVKRDQLLSNVNYDLVLSLSKNSDSYEGRLKAKFHVAPLGTGEKALSVKDLFLDFHGKSISQVRINGEHVSDVTFNHHRIHFPTSSIKVGDTNQLELRF